MTEPWPLSRAAVYYPFTRIAGTPRKRRSVGDGLAAHNDAAWGESETSGKRVVVVRERPRASLRLESRIVAEPHAAVRVPRVAVAEARKDDARCSRRRGAAENLVQGRVLVMQMVLRAARRPNDDVQLDVAAIALASHALDRCEHWGRALGCLARVRVVEGGVLRPDDGDELPAVRIAVVRAHCGGWEERS
eukprot:3782323-Pleurochrysis_carterae.AAC.1